MIKIIHIFDRTLSFLAGVAGCIIIFLMLSVSYEVVTRYFFNRPTVWVIEIGEYLLLYMLFLGTAWVLKREGHVKMDLLLNRLKPRAKSLVNFGTSFICLVCFLILTWYGVQAVLFSARIGYYKGSVIEIPEVFIIVIIPIGSFLLSIQFIRRTYGFLKSSMVSVDSREETQSWNGI